MFFKKSSKTADSPVSFNENSSQPIYIMGESPLALFLGAKLQTSGQNVVLLTSSAPANSFKNIEFTLKEEYNLQKRAISLKATSLATQEPLLLIIAAENFNIKSNLTLIPSKTFAAIPRLCFNQFENPEIIRPLLGYHCSKAYFDGYLDFDGSILTAYGSNPQIIITPAKAENEFDRFDRIFKNTELKTFYGDNDLLNFWENFAPFIIGYLCSTPKLHICEQLNNKESKNQIAAAASEICRLALFEQVQLSVEDLLKKLLNTPHGFSFKKNGQLRSHQAAELDFYYSLLSNKARIYKCKIPELNLLMKNNYNQLLKK